MRRVLIGAVAGAAFASASVALATNISVLKSGDGIHLAGTPIGCAALGVRAGNSLICSESGSHVYVQLGANGVTVTRGKPVADLNTQAQVVQMLKAGNVLLFGTWRGTSLSSQAVTLGAKVTALQTQLTTVQTQLATAKQQLAAAQSAGLAGIESQGLAGVATNVFPSLATWWKQNGGDVSASTDTSIGFADYSFSCTSCVSRG